jgi:dihydropyrimidine dehydrogenase (NAD+) subunit PreT
MSEYTRPKNKEEFEQNFSQIKPLMNQTEAYYESSRCLFCFDAPCVTACPTGIDIPLFIRQINTDNVDGAAKTIYDSNYLGNTCGKVCPTEVLCEGACVYNNQNVKPIDIGRLQSFATTKSIHSNKKHFEVGKPNGKRVAIIGAGPAGISCACELRVQGFEVNIYEAKAEPSGLISHGVAPYKITNEDALSEMAYLQKQFGYKVIYNNPINSKEKIEKLEKDYNAIFLGIGLGETKSINLKGEELTNVYGAVEFIENLKLKHNEVTIGKKVIVLGGGNTAMDAGSECARMGSDTVKLVYRGSKEQMSAYEFEYDLAKGVGVKGIFNAVPLEIIEENGKAKGVKFIKTAYKNGELINIVGSEFTEDCDMVIMATGQSKMVGFLSMIEGLELDKKGRIKVNDSFQTTNSKYYAAGDAMNGGVEVVNAVAEAKQAAIGISRYLIK